MRGRRGEGASGRQGMKGYRLGGSRGQGVKARGVKGSRLAGSKGSRDEGVK